MYFLFSNLGESCNHASYPILTTKNLTSYNFFWGFPYHPFRPKKNFFHYNIFLLISQICCIIFLLNGKSYHHNLYRIFTIIYFTYIFYYPLFLEFYICLNKFTKKMAVCCLIYFLIGGSYGNGYYPILTIKHQLVLRFFADFFRTAPFSQKYINNIHINKLH